MNDIKLSVIVLVYNQENTIAQTLDSILSQQHGYNYEIVIGDDASTDNSRIVLQKYKDQYPNIIQLIFNESNQGVVKNWVHAARHCRGEYIMGCAPDDWWLPGKVEMQISFMDAHPEYGMCYGQCRRFSETNRRYLSTLWGKECTTFAHIIAHIGHIPPMSMCFRRLLCLQYIDEIHPETRDWMMEDYPFYIWLIVHSRIYFHAVISGVYRIVENSISHPTDRRKKEKFFGSVIAVKRFWLNYTKTSYDETLLMDEYNRYLAYATIKNNRQDAVSYLTKILHPTRKDEIFIRICSIPFLYFLYVKYLFIRKLS